MTNYLNVIILKKKTPFGIGKERIYSKMINLSTFSGGVGLNFHSFGDVQNDNNFVNFALISCEEV